MRNFVAFGFALVFTCASLGTIRAQTRDTVRVMFYNILNFPTGGGGIANRQDTLAKIVAHVKPDLVMVCELVEFPGAPDLLLNQSFNVGGVTSFQRAPFVANTSTFDNLQQLIFYNSNKLRLKQSTQLATDLRDINKYILYYNDPNLPLTADSTFLDAYVTHLKASTGATNAARRDAEITVLRNHLNTNPTLRNSIFGADLNVYTSSEACYQTITTTGSYPMVDPIARPGNWNNNASFADVHTQSTRVIQLGGDGAGGGMDDRFDQILASSNIMSGANRIRYIPPTYHAVGQYGNHFNLAVNDPPANASVPANIAKALYYMSDHLPVVMDLEFTLPSLVPVRVAQFSALSFENEIQLAGRLESLEIGSQVDLQRASLGGEFLTVAAISWNQDGTFRLSDHPNKGSWRYRLALSDANGNLAYSKNVQATLAADYQWQIAQNEAGLTIFLEEGQYFDGMLEVFDLTGRQLFQTKWLREENLSSLFLPISESSKVISIRLKNLESGWQASKLILRN